MLKRSAAISMSHRSERGSPRRTSPTLQAKEDNRIDAGAPHDGVAVGHQLPDEREIELLLKAAVEVVLGDWLFEGEVSR
jgi:hypothetical protein